MKKKIPYYINGLGIISPQRTFDNSFFLAEPISYAEHALKCVTPDFKEYINPIQLRRLSKMLRIGLSAATICVRDAKGADPDGIVTATGYGFLEETAKFLNEILHQNEKHLTPTFFMQSTYNALSGLVALSLKCKGYNNTYVNKGFAFETALYDIMMQLNAETSKSFLVGSYDETEIGQYKINLRVGHYKTEPLNSLELFDHASTPGSLQGEGSAFFFISGEHGLNSWCRLVDVKMLFKPATAGLLSKALQDFLMANAMSVQDIDVWINGASGDVKNDKLLTALSYSILRDTQEARFKHLCGEYCTASSFGVWLGASILKKQHVPEIAKFSKVENNNPIKTVLLINQYMGRNYSFILLQQT
jgi:3-oxoacyl-[acyl-carrier-protein] synthase II